MRPRHVVACLLAYQPLWCYTSVLFDHAASRLHGKKCYYSKCGVHRFSGPCMGVWVPKLSLGDDFNRPLDEVVWPAFLEKLSFGLEFKQPIEEVVWPASLEQLSFGSAFNQSIDGVVWPVSLRELHFGKDFDLQCTSRRNCMSKLPGQPNLRGA